MPVETRSANTEVVSVIAHRILVLDDEPEVGNILFRALSADGYDVTLTPDGESARKLVQENHFDNIFLDLRMPGVDGRELYQSMTEFSPDLAKKVVFITGDMVRADTARFLDLIGNPVLTKPFTIESIRELL